MEKDICEDMAMSRNVDPCTIVDTCGQELCNHDPKRETKTLLMMIVT